MAAGRVTMHRLGKMFVVTMRLAMMELWLFSFYVDDVRKGGTSIRLGLRFVGA